MFGAEYHASLASSALVIIGCQSVGHGIVIMGAKGALSLAASALAAFFFVPYNLELRKDE